VRVGMDSCAVTSRTSSQGVSGLSGEDGEDSLPSKTVS